MRLKLYILLIICLLLIPAWAGAATYYMRAGGTAANKAAASGPCATAANCMSVATHDADTYSAGDTIILCDDGGAFRDQMDIPSSGSDGSPITYAAASGDSPVISGADLVSTWSDDGGNEWSATLSTEPDIVFFDGTVGTEVSASCPSLTSDQEWCWAANTLYQYSTSDPDTRYTSPGTEAGQNRYGIHVAAKDYITIDGITVKYTDLEGIRIERSDHATVQNCDISWTYKSCIYAFSNSTSNLLTDVLIDSNALTSCGYQGIMVEALGGSQVDNITISKNIVDDAARSDNADGGTGIVAWQDESGSPGSAITDLVIEYNVVKNTAQNEPAGFGDAGKGIWLDNLCPDAGSSSSIVRYNLVYDNDRHGIEIEKSKGVAVYGNVIYSDDSVGIRLRGGNGGTAGGINCAVEDTVVYNNTVYDSGSAPLLVDSATDVGGGKHVLNNTVSNNIFFRAAGTVAIFEGGGENDGSEGSGNVYTYNCFGPERANFIEWGDGNFDSTYDDWETAYGGTTNSVEAAPLFTDAGSDEFWLQIGSPAINAGVDLGASYEYGLDPASSWADNVITKLQTGLWDIGAYVYESTQDQPAQRGVNFYGDVNYQ